MVLDVFAVLYCFSDRMEYGLVGVVILYSVGWYSMARQRGVNRLGIFFPLSFESYQNAIKSLKNYMCQTRDVTLLITM